MRHLDLSGALCASLLACFFVCFVFSARGWNAACFAASVVLFCFCPGTILTADDKRALETLLHSSEHLQVLKLQGMCIFLFSFLFLSLRMPVHQVDLSSPFPRLFSERN